MAIKKREYFLSINDFKEPDMVEGQQAIALLLIRLIMLDPGSDPLHPTMGVGIRNYRYGMFNLDELQSRIQNQITTFLPDYQDAVVAIVRTPDKTCNIEIKINDTTYIYDSATAPIPISLSDVTEG